MAKEKHHGIENPDAHRADMERRQSSAAGTHDERPNRERSRHAAKRAAIQRDRD